MHHTGLGIAALFVALWSTGFLGAKLGLPYIEAMTFLTVRFGIVAVLLWLWVVVRGTQMLSMQEFRHQAIVGILVHYVYLGGVFAGIGLGVSAGVAAMIVGLQPLATAAAARVMLHERLGYVQMLGMALGVGGVATVLFEKFDTPIGHPVGLLLCFIALVGIAVGSILQKRWGDATPVAAGNAVQFASATLCCLATAVAFETMNVVWSGELIFALAWLVLVLSIGAVGLLYWLIRRGAAYEVASLFFLVPPVTAALAWVLFDERMSILAIAGMIITAVGVMLVHRGGTRFVSEPGQALPKE